jgi:serine kinase of HPr protein (carbohydrate metabolism regulator)
LVSAAGAGILIRGRSGAGKSDLALRLMTTTPTIAGRAPTVVLVADDQVILERRAGKVFGSVPASIAGRIEVRGIGIVALPYEAETQVRLVVDLVARREVVRYPESEMHVELLGIAIPRLKLAAHDASAPIKVLLGLRQLQLEA